MDTAGSLRALQAYGGNLKGSPPLWVVNRDGKKRLEFAPFHQKSWFSRDTTDLSKVCEVATQALKDPWIHWKLTYSWGLRAGLEKLQGNVSQHWMRQSASPAMVEFVKQFDQVLYPEPYLITRILRAIIGSFSPFSPTLVSPATAASAKASSIGFQCPDVRTKVKGNVNVADLPKLDSSILPQKQTIMNKFLAGKQDSGNLEYTQFSVANESILNVTSDVIRPEGILREYRCPFDYKDVSGHFTCTANFADMGLFKYWKHHFFAQDEVQVAEHPDLGRLQAHLSGFISSPQTETRGGNPAPWLVKGVKRHGIIDTKKLYGAKQLLSVSESYIKRNTTRIGRPTTSNILTITAIPLRRNGLYSSHEILKSFLAAYTAFKGAKQEAARLGKPLALQTGNWGSGAFGNDAKLMAVIQILAARCAGVDRLDYYTYDAAGHKAYVEAKQYLQAIDKLRDSGSIPTIGSVLRILYQTNFRHGISNGT
ncbi:MAG: hypothetical protein Q8K75_10795 [Chlamydiales bacterium]|nr:hypothetical protein [Chlamydiales bacterium]